MPLKNVPCIQNKEVRGVSGSEEPVDKAINAKEDINP